jgi:hypothetical protein
MNLEPLRNQEEAHRTIMWETQAQELKAMQEHSARSQMQEDYQ